MTRTQAIATARRMWDNGKGGWTIAEIQRYLAGQGHSVAWSKVKCWADEAYAAEFRRRDRERNRRLDRRRRSTKRFAVLDDDALLALRVEDGLTYSSIARVASRFFGEAMTEDQVRHRLYELGAPKNPNKTRTRAAA